MRSIRQLILSTALVVGAALPLHAENLRIGLIAPMTGSGSAWGKSAEQAAKILAKRVNQTGGLEVAGEKHEVEIVVYDDEYKAANAVAVYNRLVNLDGINLMIILTSPSTLALKDAVEAEDVVALTGSYSVEAITAQTRNMFRIYSTSTDYMPAAIDWVSKSVPGKRISIVDPNDETGWDHFRVASKIYERHGYEVLNSDLFERSTKDFAPLVTRLIGANPEIIDLGGTPPATAVLLVRQLHEFGFKGQVVKTAGTALPEIIAGTEREASNGLINIALVDPQNEAYKALAAEYRAAVGQEPNDIIVPVYDGLNALLSAVQKAGTFQEPRKIVEALPSVMPQKTLLGAELTIGGKETYGSDNQMMSTVYIARANDGQVEILGAIK